MKKFNINQLKAEPEHLVMVAPFGAISKYDWKNQIFTEEQLFNSIIETKTLPSCLIIDLNLFSNLEKLKELILQYSFSTSYFIYKFITHDQESMTKAKEFNSWFLDLIFPKKLK